MVAFGTVPSLFFKDPTVAVELKCPFPLSHLGERLRSTEDIDHFGQLGTGSYSRKEKMPKAPAKKEPTTDFANLVRNRIDFLAKVMAQLDSDPKHSVKNFIRQ